MLKSSTLSPSPSEQALLWTLRFFALLSGVISLLIFVFLILESLPSLSSVGIMRFFSDASWNPTSKLFNLVPMVWGSLYATAGALLISAPLGIILAVFCRYYSPFCFSIVIKRLIEVAAGIPSVVYGFWGLVVLAPKINDFHPPGASLLAGILILSLMVLPTMFLSAEAALASLPNHYESSAKALGFTPSTMITNILLPAAAPNLVAGSVLQMGKALGETMALLMVCGNVVQTPESIFDPIRTLTTNIALEMAYATGGHRSALFVSGFLLMTVVAILIFVVHGITNEKRIRL